VRHRLSQKLSILFASLFAIVLAASALFVHRTVHNELAITMKGNLERATDLIRRLVETRAEEQWGVLAGAVQMAELMTDGKAEIDAASVFRYRVLNEYTYSYLETDLPGMIVRRGAVSQDPLLAKDIGSRFGGIAAFYQKAPEGFVLISSSRSNSGPYRGLPEFIPVKTPIHDLVVKNGFFIGRDHFFFAWYLTAWKVLRQDGEITGAVFLASKQVEMDKLRQDVLSIGLEGGGFPYIIDASSSKVVIHPEIEGESLWSYPHIRDIQFKRDGFISSVRHDIHTPEGGEYILSYSYIRSMNWIVVAEASTEIFFHRLREIQVILAFIFTAAMIASVFLSFLVGSQITRPIVGITQKIKEISEGEADLTKHLEVVSNDEVGELCEYFNTFMAKLRRLKEVEQREVEMQLRDSQMNALQAQINPHFLYNTLETIRFMIAGGDREAVSVVQDLADLLRLSLGHGERYVTIKRELDHVLLYLSIQSVRYENRFTVELDVDARLDELYTAKFILQPLVENALTHGFRSLSSGGVITIEGKIDQGRVRLSVSDNGCGMDRSRLHSLKVRLDRGYDGGSIGLRNVSERIRLYFGEQYGINIKSSLGKGTRITLLLPLLPVEPEQKGVVEALRFAPDPRT
jgi:sensor histidine kinase YesM